MKWKNFLIGVSVGITVAYLVKDKLKTPAISSEKALSIVKKAFKERGPINGSWIYTIPQAYEKNDLTYEVYKTGVSRTVDGQVEQYEAIVDAKSGVIIDVKQTA